MILITYYVKTHFYYGKEISFNYVMKYSFMIISGLIILIFFSFLPSAWATARAPETRSLNFSNIFISVFNKFCFNNYWSIIPRNYHNKSKLQKDFSLIIGLSSIYFLIAVPINEARQVYLLKSEAMTFATRWDEREIQIREKIKANETHLIVKMIPTNLMELEYLQTNSTHWINICAAEYYGVDLISAE